MNSTIWNRNINWHTSLLFIQSKPTHTLSTSHIIIIRYTIGNSHNLRNRLTSLSRNLIWILRNTSCCISYIIGSCNTSSSYSRIEFIITSSTITLIINFYTIWIIDLNAASSIQIVKISLVTDITNSLST